MLLFLFTMQSSTGIDLTSENIGLAARLTFGNVVLISFLLSVIDEVWHWFAVTRPVRHIVRAAEKIMDGDFSVRIQSLIGIDNGRGFNTIIDYFNRMAEELSGIETLRTDFIANVSHELKTPLAVIQNYGTMLQAPDLSEEQRLEYAKTVTASSRRLADLITNILKLNRLENQQIYPEKKIYDLGEQLCECLLGFESTWEKKNIDIDTDIEDGVLIESDPELLTLVWNNLFSNAMKFTEPGGKVSLTLKTDGEFAVVQVSDTGCGISPEVGQHIFEKFYQGDTSHA
ncbi:MAG: HAMP domain-containing histidine kinase, partial [Oscillospiraceae bacterium]|nr:HAMP domain-containing histidine kinase [Oscillospiraceae bacterium]